MIRRDDFVQVHQRDSQVVTGQVSQSESQPVRRHWKIPNPNRGPYSMILACAMQAKCLVGHSHVHVKIIIKRKSIAGWLCTNLPTKFSPVRCKERQGGRLPAVVIARTRTGRRGGIFPQTLPSDTPEAWRSSAEGTAIPFSLLSRGVMPHTTNPCTVRTLQRSWRVLAQMELPRH